MSLNCVVFGCTNTWQKAAEEGKTLHFYSFSSRAWNQPQMQKWIAFVGRKGRDGKEWKPTKFSKICSQHFVGNQRSMNPLSPSFNPTIHPVLSKKSPESSRFKRHCSRTSGKKTASVRADEQETVEDCTIEVGGEANHHERPAVSNVEVQTLSLSTVSAYQQTDVKMTDKSAGPYSREVCFTGYKSVQGNEKKLIELAGVNFQVFSVFLSTISDQPITSGLQKEDRLLLTFAKLKHGISYAGLGCFFGVTGWCASQVFVSTLSEIYSVTKDWIFMPSQKIVRRTTPPSFVDYRKCRGIIDCTEFRTERPSGVEAQFKMYSNYKGAWTIKVLVCVTPGGFISFMSEAYGGRASDPLITNNCGILNHFQPGDIILAYKGFPNIKVHDGTVVLMPPFSSKSRPQFSVEEMNETYKIASVRIHVERAIQRLKIFNIFRNVIPTELFPYIDAILHVCTVATNLSAPIIKTE